MTHNKSCDNPADNNCAHHARNQLEMRAHEDASKESKHRKLNDPVDNMAHKDINE